MSSDNRLRPFWGELLTNPSPLEVSFNNCDRSCEYCFARLNGRNITGETARGTLSFIVNSFKGGDQLSSENFARYLLRKKHSVVLSNAVDPLAVGNLESTFQLLDVLGKFDVPVVLQTRGMKRVRDFQRVLDALPRGSIVYMSFTTFDRKVIAEMERGCPSGEERLEQAAMAGAMGIPVIAGLNPAVPAWMGDPYEFVGACESIAGKGTIKGAWYEALHLSQRQNRTIANRFGGSLPVVAETAFEDATAGVYDGEWFDRLVEAIDDKGWRRFNLNLGEDDEAGLFDLYPRPFFPRHPALQECRRIHEESGGRPVLVTFDAWCSWIGITDEVVMSRGDAWSFLNAKNNAGQENRAAMPKTMTLRQCLRFLWNRPDIAFTGVRGGTPLKNIIKKLDPEDEKSWRFVTAEGERDDDLLMCYCPGFGGEGTEAKVVHEDEIEFDLEVLPLRPGWSPEAASAFA